MSQDTLPKGHLHGPEPEEDPKLIATSMTFADISIRNHVFAWMLMFGLMGFGIVAFRGAGGVVKGLGIPNTAIGLSATMVLPVRSRRPMFVERNW